MGVPGFDALPGGVVRALIALGFRGVGETGYFWTSSDHEEVRATWAVAISPTGPEVSFEYFDKGAFGLSVRYVKD